MMRANDRCGVIFKRRATVANRPIADDPSYFVSVKFGHKTPQSKTHQSAVLGEHNGRLLGEGHE